MNKSTKVFDALEFAARKHAGQVRKISGEPYICHPIRVMGFASQYIYAPQDHEMQDILAAAALHDTVEDTDTTYSEIAQRFGVPVAELVRDLTNIPKRKDEKRHDYKSRINLHLSTVSKRAQELKLCDRLDNLLHRGANLTDDNIRWIKKYAKETRNLLAAIGHSNESLKNRVNLELQRNLMLPDSINYGQSV